MGEGRKRQIREIGKTLGLPVVRIVRVRIGTLRLGTLKPGDWRYLTADELAELKGERPIGKGTSSPTRQPHSRNRFEHSADPQKKSLRSSRFRK